MSGSASSLLLPVLCYYYLNASGVQVTGRTTVYSKEHYKYLWHKVLQQYIIVTSEANRKAYLKRLFAI